jgi:hypothetical protein
VLALYGSVYLLPQYLTIVQGYSAFQTPFVATRVDSKDYWIALVEFFFGSIEQEALHAMAVILYDPATSEHQFMTPADLTEAVNETEI